MHLVLPDNNPFGESVQPASASVVVIHRPDAEVESMVPQIKQIVLGGVADLEVDAVSVELVEANVELLSGRAIRRTASSSPKIREILTIQVAQSSAPRLLAVLVAAGAVFLIGLGLMVFSFIRRPRHSKKAG